MNRRLLLLCAAGMAAAAAWRPPLRAQQGARSPHGALDLECGACHSAEGWKPIAPQRSFDHGKTGFALKGRHAKAACASCHRTLVFNKVATACADCHQDPHRGELGQRCDSCHTEQTWAGRREMWSVHNRTRFPLVAVHARLACEDCHKGQRAAQFAGTPTDCGSCHSARYQAAIDPSHVLAGFSPNCEDCHRATAPDWRLTSYRHPPTPLLAGGHTQARCVDCHATRFQGTPQDCVSCHRAQAERATSPPHAPPAFGADCESCHRVAAWRPASFDHTRTRFPLTGAHAARGCVDCHQGGRYASTASDCYSCHRPSYEGTSNPGHVAAGFPTDCSGCHATSAWRPASGIDHNRTRFPLTGAHTRANCTQCHAGGRYSGTPTDCASCHRSDYDRTTNPNHPAGGFPTTCAGCHSTSAWRPASGIDHNQTRFPLTGAHTRASCTQCHANGQYSGTPTACFSCHQSDYQQTSNPNHAASGLPTQCESCHGTSAWRPATLDHNRTRFPLTGAHRNASCNQCHVNGQYTGTPTACFSCHQSDYQQTNNPNHAAAGFPTQCESCHGTSAWRPSTWNHDTLFPIYSGKHRGKWNACTDCHVAPGNFRVFECIRCHPHNNKPEVDAKHHEVQGYQYTSTACYSCHPRGNE